MDNEALILEITKDCPAGDREDICQDLRIELFEIYKKDTTINSRLLRTRLIDRRNRLVRKYKLGGITQAPADPQIETIGIEEHFAAHNLCYGGYPSET